jgi:hypothetical protein
MSKHSHPESIYELLAASAVAHPDKTAITYIELFRYTHVPFAVYPHDENARYPILSGAAADAG